MLQIASVGTLVARLKRYPMIFPSGSVDVTPKPQALALALASFLILISNIGRTQELAPTRVDSAPPQGDSPNAPSTDAPAGSSLNSGSTASVPHREPASYDVMFAADLGGSEYTEEVANGGPVLGMSALARMHIFAVGPYAQLEDSFFYRQSSQALGLAGGISYRSRKGVHFDVLGTLSLHHYAGWGGGRTFANDPVPLGAQATLPCGGVRARMLYVVPGPGRGHLMFGLQLGYDVDLKHELANNPDGYGNGTTQVPVGGSRWTLGFVIGDAIDIGAR
jgi:hypothetical protein